MSLRRILFSTILAAAVAAPAFARTSVAIDIGVAPPAPRYEVVPVARPGYVWAPGYWAWDHGRHVWMEGRWMAQRPGYVWVPEHWVQRGPNWHFVPGHWRPVAPPPVAYYPAPAPVYAPVTPVIGADVVYSGHYHH